MKKLFLISILAVSGFAFGSDTKYEKDEKVNQETRQKNSEALLKAVVAGDDKEITRILDTKNVDINVQDDQRRTPLFLSLKNAIEKHQEHEKYEKIATQLIQEGADVNSGVPPLLMAAVVKNESLLQLLLDKGANINGTDAKQNNALHYAIRGKGARPRGMSGPSGVPKVIGILLENKININAKNSDGETALTRALNRGDVDIARLLIKRGAEHTQDDIKKLKELNTIYGLDFAISKGDEKKLKELLEMDYVDVNGISSITQKTPLGYAIFEDNNPNIVKLLLEHGANIESDSLRSAIENNNHNIVKLLLENGAKIDDDSLEKGIVKKNPDIVKLLLEYGAKIDGKLLMSFIWDLETSLKYGDKSDQIKKILKLLIAYGADINDEKLENLVMKQQGGLVGMGFFNIEAAQRVVETINSVISKTVGSDWKKLLEEYHSQKDSLNKEYQEKVKKSVGKYMIPDLANIAAEYGEYTFKEFIRDKHSEKLKELEEFAS